MRGAGRSLRDLLASSRYRELRRHLTDATLASTLAAQSSVIDQWLAYSEDKRTSGGWYFAQQQSGWVVGRVRPPRADRFSNAASACAAFILRELDFWTAVSDEPAPLAAGRFEVDRVFRRKPAPGLCIAGRLTEGTASAGMKVNIWVDGDAYLTPIVRAIEPESLNPGSSGVLCLEPSDPEDEEWLTDLIPIGRPIVLSY